MTTKIDTYKLYKQNIVDADFGDLKSKPGDIRAAFHASISLFHLADWVYHAHKGAIDASFTYLVGGVAKAVHDEKSFANALADMHPDFELVRGVANAAKHLALNPKTVAKARAPHTPSHAANTQARNYGALNTAPLNTGPIGGGWTEVELEGTNRTMVDIASSVHQMWEDLFRKHGW